MNRLRARYSKGWDRLLRYDPVSSPRKPSLALDFRWLVEYFFFPMSVDSLTR